MQLFVSCHKSQKLINNLFNNMNKNCERVHAYINVRIIEFDSVDYGLWLQNHYLNIRYITVKLQ